MKKGETKERREEVVFEKVIKVSRMKGTCGLRPLRYCY
jgi:hypothetical protein